METVSDDQRFTEIYREHFGAIEAYVARRCDPSRTADVVADVFVTAWRRFPDLPGTAPLPWLYGVARRTLANDRRSQQRQLKLAELLVDQRPAGDYGPHPDDVIAELDLVKAFDLLSTNDQEVLGLALWEELSISESGKALGCSAASARVRLFRARKRLRTLLAKNSASQTISGGDRARKEAHA
ncbi:RNA polymerase sigma factor [Streptomyces sp. NPDC056002]|uniref:RNA polymerase sigma factor n=1 Tax=Streptomyces sp. NPDC056002 TaxID=3345675 RepID=UPI0035E0400D